MNLPNRITLSRILLIPVVIFFYLSQPFLACGKLLAAIIFVIACLTDFFDGYYARKFNLVTTIGKFMDTIADKLLVLSALILVICDATIPSPYGAIFAIIIIARELMVSALRQLAASKNVIIAADMWGKVKANFQYVSLTAYMLLSYFVDVAVLPGWAMTALEVVCWVSMIATVFSTVMSGVHYVVKNKAVFVDEKESKNEDVNPDVSNEEKMLEYDHEENFGN
ncbi:MAG: CDP-diacylglycerol--glycerol-3-phosphate 3-phosphatidyltransferase [Clostridia bacterium]|nr:CDP-diacylglycerol--glycerol-3-phosphate 3-phosphatidyltransferase [Clostridia bacterium]